MSRSLRIQAAALTAVLLCSLSLAWAQTPTGGIEGTITDQSGAVIPGAKVTITEAATGRVFPPMTSDSMGRYVMRNLLPGQYHVKVEAPNLAGKEVRDITVSSGAIVNINVGLEVRGSARCVHS